jgi:Spy/CpxP family protein refolding chaperone
MKTLKYALTCALAVAFIATASAQNATNTPANQPGLQNRVAHQDRLIKELNLTPDQTVKWKAVQTNFLNEAKAIRDNAQLSPDERKTQITALRATLKTKIAAILTPEQLTKLQSLQAKQGNRPHPAGTPQ